VFMRICLSYRCRSVTGVASGMTLCRETANGAGLSSSAPAASVDSSTSVKSRAVNFQKSMLYHSLTHLLLHSLYIL